MQLHHLGYACHDIDNALAFIRALYQIKNISEVIFDEEQNDRE